MAKSDDQTTLKELKEVVKKFRSVRGWEGEDPKDVALSLVLEACELLEHFQWKTGKEVSEEARLYGPICDELADVLWWVLVMAERLDIDLAHAFEIKTEKNDNKYPKEMFAKHLSEAEKRRAYYRIKAKARGSHPLADADNSS